MTVSGKSPYNKVDFIKKAGIVQRFYSVNPNPLDKPSPNNIKSTPERGFLRIDNVDELYDDLRRMINESKEFFSSMLPKRELGRIIEMASREKTYEKKAEKFLKLLRGVGNG